MGIPILLASETAIDSLLTSIMNKASGKPPISVTPPIDFSSLSMSRCIFKPSFLVSLLNVPSSFCLKRFSSLVIDDLIVL